MIARLIVSGDECWHWDVTRATSSGRHLTLDLSTHQSRVHYWLGPRTRVLLAATGADVTAMLREERQTSSWSRSGS